ncbi:PAS domain-containing protein [Erythrobacteraceae bacterium WH01K]|nr:PAS domain-containing protein [Erythrobacteraceae bacterium WH01K]
MRELDSANRELRKSEEELVRRLELQNQQLVSAQRTGGFATIHGGPGEPFTSSVQLSHIFGYPPDKQMTPKDVVARIHPLDARRMMAETKRFYSELPPDIDYEFDHRIVHPETGTRWLRWHMRRSTGKGRTARGIYGSVRDITEIRQNERTVRMLQLRAERRVKELDRVTQDLEVERTRAEDALAVRTAAGRGRWRRRRGGPASHRRRGRTFRPAGRGYREQPADYRCPAGEAGLHGADRDQWCRGRGPRKPRGIRRRAEERADARHGRRNSRPHHPVDGGRLAHTGHRHYPARLLQPDANRIPQRANQPGSDEGGFQITCKPLRRCSERVDRIDGPEGHHAVGADGISAAQRVGVAQDLDQQSIARSKPEGRRSQLTWCDPKGAGNGGEEGIGAGGLRGSCVRRGPLALRMTVPAASCPGAQRACDRLAGAVRQRIRPASWTRRQGWRAER